MEQHNIDSRFKEGLGNISRQPSSDAWARLQNQMAAPPQETPVIEPEKEDRKKPVFWLSIAAAIITLLVSVAVFWSGREVGVISPELASNKTSETDKVTTESKIQEAIVAEKKSEVAVAETKKNIETQTTQSKTSVKLVKSGIEKLNQKAVAQAKVNSPVQQAAKENTKIEHPVTKPEIVNTESQPQLALQTPTNNPVKATAPDTDLAGKSIEVIVKKDNSDDNQMVAQANVSEPQNHEVKKPALIKSIFKQARNLKNGEEVNLAAIGITPNSRLVAETRNLQDKFSKVFQN